MLNTARTNSLYRAQLRRYYTEAELKQWITDGQNGMRTRAGQVARWQAVLETLREEKEECLVTPVMSVKDVEVGSVKSAEEAIEYTDTIVSPVEEPVGSNALPVEVLDITKYHTLAQAQAYVAADRAWWTSLMRPPFNAKKDAQHATLDAERRRAFLAFGAGIQVAKGKLQHKEQTQCLSMTSTLT